MSIPCIVVATCALALFSVSVRGQEQTGAATDDAATVLAGPKVRTEEGTEGSLDFRGEMRRPDARPEELAAAGLSLSESHRAAVDAILRRRAERLDQIIAANLDLLTKLGTASQTGDRLDQLMLSLEAIEKLRPLTREGTLRRQIAEALPPEQRLEFNRALNAYWREVARHGKDLPGDDGKPRGVIGAAIAEGVQLFTEEVERSFRRQAESGQLVLNLILAGLELSPEQEARIGAIVAEFAAATQAQPTERQQLLFGVAIGAHLTESQRRVVMQRLLGLRPGNEQ